MAGLGLFCRVGLSLVAVSRVHSLVAVSRGHSLVVVHGLLISGASLVAEHGLQGTQASVVVAPRPLGQRLKSCGTRA